MRRVFRPLAGWDYSAWNASALTPDPAPPFPAADMLLSSQQLLVFLPANITNVMNECDQLALRLISAHLPRWKVIDVAFIGTHHQSHQLQNERETVLGCEVKLQEQRRLD